jgi:hypothetical protein
MAISRRDVFSIGAVAAITAVGVGGYSSYASTSIESELDGAIDGLRQAFEQADHAALNAFMHPNLSFGHSNGLIQTREEFVRSVVSKSEIFNSLQLTQHDNSIIGDVAIARHRFIADITYQGKPLNVDLGELQVWRRTEGSWRLFARQAFAD